MSRPLNVLFIEDSEDDACLLTLHLKQEGFEVRHHRVEREDQLRAALEESLWDVVLCDMSMPYFDPFSALEVVRSTVSELPFIVVSGSVEEEDLIALMRAGADDVIVKKRLSRLVPAIDRSMKDAAVRKKGRLAHVALLESEERFRKAFETAPHGMALVSPEGTWLMANQALCGLIGYSETELQRTDFQTITHPDDLEEDQSYVRQVLGGTISSYQMEKRYIHKNGQAVPVLLSVSLVRDSQGHPLYFVSQVLDLTARREVEAKLLQSQKMEAVGQLTGGVAHDFNNLLTVILGNIRLLERQMADGDAVVLKQLGSASTAARRAADLTKRLLAFSRKGSLEPSLVEVAPLVTDTLDLLNRTLGETIEIETALAEGLAPVMVDANQLENALLNLATNARDAMRQGGTLKVSLNSYVANERRGPVGSGALVGEYVILSVSDSGCGIPPEHLERIYEPFFTTKDVGEGTGLGLSMVFGFVQQSGGHITVDSKVGRGTTFKLYLPVASTTRLADSSNGEASEGLPGGDETILVVEDEVGVRTFTVDLLRTLGYRVHEAGDGPQALALLEAEPNVDLLFSDIVMPGGMSGLELADEVHKQWPAIRLLYTTGYSDSVFGLNLSAGQNEMLLNKPYEGEALAVKVREILDQRGP